MLPRFVACTLLIVTQSRVLSYSASVTDVNHVVMFAKDLSVALCPPAAVA